MECPTIAYVPHPNSRSPSLLHFATLQFSSIPHFAAAAAFLFVFHLYVQRGTHRLGNRRGGFLRVLRQWANSVCVNVCMCVAASKMSGMGEEGAHERLHHCMLSCSKWEGEKCGGETEYAGKSSCLKRGREKYTGRDFFSLQCNTRQSGTLSRKKHTFCFFGHAIKQ